jgi:DNA-binding Lrp family transcriptional regulator
MPANETLSLSKQQQIYELGQQTPRLSNREIGAMVGVEKSTAQKYRDLKPSTPEVKAAPAESIHDEIKRTLRKGAKSVDDIADALDCSPRRVRESLEKMKASGVLLIERHGGLIDIAPSITLPPGEAEVKGTDGEWTHVFGVTSDNHLCNKHSRLDVLAAAYDHFERVGITTVYNCGNWIDGEAKFNKTELITRPGMDSQLDYMIDKWPVRKGITTHYIAGSDHEGWFQEREGIEIGRYLQLRAEDQGRQDLKYLGYAECDVKLMHGNGAAVMRVLHPGGGSAYAISYTDQKRVESYQGGEKPQIELAGHYHKWSVGYPREVHTVQVGCTSDQSLFMRKKRLQAHVGFVVIKIQQDGTDGHVTRFCAEWVPFFDRGYYEKRY